MELTKQGTNQDILTHESLNIGKLYEIVELKKDPCLFKPGDIVVVLIMQKNELLIRIKDWYASTSLENYTYKEVEKGAVFIYE